MEDEIKNLENKKDFSIPISIFLSSLILASSWIYAKGLEVQKGSQQPVVDLAPVTVEAKELPVVLGDLGAKMISAGVIDAEKLESLYSERGGLTKEMKDLLYGSDNGN